MRQRRYLRKILIARTMPLGGLYLVIKYCYVSYGEVVLAPVQLESGSRTNGGRFRFILESPFRSLPPYRRLPYPAAPAETLLPFFRSDTPHQPLRSEIERAIPSTRVPSSAGLLSSRAIEGFRGRAQPFMRMFTGSHSTVRCSKQEILDISAGPAARNPNTGSSITGLRDRTALKKFW